MTGLTPAAQYLRRSTEHQQYSLENQADVIRDYAAKNGMHIIETYADASSGMEGLRRKGLKRLLDDVRSGNAQYKIILVYDVSRWGRFLDADESAYYEFICKLSGVNVHYCAEMFQNDGTLLNFLIKSMKRMMAAEYIRELSDKVVDGQKRLALLGFRTGGMAGYGLRRMLVSKDGKPKQFLRDGERKSIQDDRIVLVPGPKHETDVVREIHQMYLDGLSLKSICGELNGRGVAYPGKKAKHWYHTALARILHSPKYCGSMVYGRTSQKLNTGRKRKPQDAWTTCQGAWEAVVDRSTFERVQQKYHSRTEMKSNNDLLEDLRQLAQREGFLHTSMFGQSHGMASEKTYRDRFGSLTDAWRLIGYDRGFQAKVACLRKSKELRQKLIAEVVDSSGGKVSTVQPLGNVRAKLKLQNGILVSVYICRHDVKKALTPRWLLFRAERRRVSLIARLRPNNQEFDDFHIIRAVPNKHAWAIKPNDPYLQEGIKLESLQDFAAAVEKIYRGRRGETVMHPK
jgi:DNA invertase Pin-like site-specific DNA recombinase